MGNRIEFSYGFLVEDEYEYKESGGVSCGVDLKWEV